MRHKYTTIMMITRDSLKIVSSLLCKLSTNEVADVESCVVVGEEVEVVLVLLEQEQDGSA